MAPVELRRRQSARVTGTFLGKFKSGEMPADEVRGLFMRGAEAAPNLALLDATRASAPPHYIETCARITKGERMAC